MTKIIMYVLLSVAFSFFSFPSLATAVKTKDFFVIFLFLFGLPFMSAWLYMYYEISTVVAIDASVFAGLLEGFGLACFVGWFAGFVVMRERFAN